ncbi:hypothetical protein 1 [Wuhan house centipede virus 4]|uniref:hypothetical protein 1 n=1 Tax=Wuhan house centipede virus 4 TaxID=1923708 RepID=UPI000909B595|nr:hypothetical protein 1 [Wuhan house centipede virus 4]APG75651.1 hypothetical protein [Wuhan house centipede virus 4]APG75945.1 hypothetical protein 1 [Wuhan house centipede virus 4]
MYPMEDFGDTFSARLYAGVRHVMYDLSASLRGELRPRVWLALAAFSFLLEGIFMAYGQGGPVSLAIHILGWIGTVWSWVGRWWRRAQIKWEQEQHGYRTMPESVREGSPLLNVTRPNFVVGVFALYKGKKILLGTAWRYRDNLITAAHVVMEKNFDKILIHIAKTDVYYEAPDWKHVVGDVAIHPMQATWPIPSAKIDTIAKSAFVMAFSARDTSNASSGLLKHKPAKAMGFLQYEGSTLPGFSGSPYFTGTKVLGMHIGGGSAGNFGFSASFIEMMIKSRRRPESSDLEMVKRVLRTTRVVDFDYEQGLDETRIRIDGRYVELPNEEFWELFDDEEFEDYFYEFEDGSLHQNRNKKKKKQYNWDAEPDLGDDYEPESAIREPVFQEVPPSGIPTGVEDQVTELRNMHTSLMTSLEGLETRISSGQQEMKDNLREVFTSMLADERDRYEGMLNQVETKLIQLSGTCYKQIQSDLDDRICRVMQSSPIISTTSCAPSTPKAQQDSVTSKNTRPLVTHWVGMESDLQKFETWRNSVDVSRSDYVVLRDKFLRDGLSLNISQAEALIARFRNRQRTTKRRVKKPTPPTQ